MHNQEQEIAQSLRPARIIVPILIGLGAVGYLLYTQFDAEKFRAIVWDTRAWALILLAFGLLLCRHASYSMRLQALTGLGWRKCLQLMVVWEFSTTIAPTSKGGPVVMMFALPREGVRVAKTIAAVLYTIILDSGFFVLLLPVLLTVYGSGMLFPAQSDFGSIGLATGAFMATYALMATYWCFLILVVFVRPQWARPLMARVARIGFLKKWRTKIEAMGEEFTTAAIELRAAPASVHVRSIVGTLGAWTLKFALINCIIVGIWPSVPLDGSTQLLIYARMTAMFIVLAFSPTPGGAGIAELALPRFISDFVPLSVGLVVALVWRGMAYYGYLLAGVLVVPGWLARGRKG
jgi:glycosyltransferase 2 family protein